MNIGQLRTLTNSELIRHLEPVMHHSAVILELTQRLQRAEDEEAHLETLNDKIECPVCRASLQVDIDWNNNLLTCKVNPLHA